MAEHPAPTLATEVPGHAPAETHAAPSFMGLEAPTIVALAVLVVIALLLWKKVPAAVGKALDKKIAGIREQLAEAEALRKEAETLRDEYAAKAAAADAEAAAIRERARHEADAVLAKAQQDAEALVERRSRMAEEKIAAEERSAVEQLRATAADAARQAAGRLIAERMDAATDEAIVARTISGLGR